ncbi:CXADR-like membrane protein [Chanos chanos]|uniref:CXADR-like membrane protein n=1 Tax=Chanos chanos TaxID=29144 RepID=A0A6J2WBW2_CHACN|nr:CXADR-like membrane protein [Chanos chanos]
MRAGVSGQIRTVFSRDGDDVTLTCLNMVNPDCSSTEWLFSYNGSAIVELVTDGKISVENRERADRLSLGSDCSLNINKVRPQDAGDYTCRQSLSGDRLYGTDARVFLRVLEIRPQTQNTEMKLGSSVTLYCLLNTERSECNSQTLPDGLNLIWVDETGTDLSLTDSRLKISSSIYCPRALTVRLQHHDNNRKWTCQLTDRGEVKTSVSYMTTWTGRK